MRFVVLLIAAVVAVAAGVAALQYSGKNANPQPAAVAAVQPTTPNVSTVDVLVAKTIIPMGTTLEASMIERQPWPSHLVLDGMITADSKDANLVGKVARAPFSVREPLMSSKIANPNDPSFLAAVLPEGMRAVTIATDAISGVAGYVFPGDHVDLLLTHSIPRDVRTGNDIRVGKPQLSEVLAANVRVLAVNVRPQPGKESAANTPANVTLEVTEQDAQKIRLAEKNGGLSLALRSIKDKDNIDVPAVMPVTGLTHAGTGSAPTPEGIRVVRGVGKPAEGLMKITARPEADPEPMSEERQ